MGMDFFLTPLTQKYSLYGERLEAKDSPALGKGLQDAQLPAAAALSCPVHPRLLLDWG